MNTKHKLHPILSQDGVYLTSDYTWKDEIYSNEGDPTVMDIWPMSLIMELRIELIRNYFRIQDEDQPNLSYRENVSPQIPRMIQAIVELDPVRWERDIYVEDQAFDMVGFTVSDDLSILDDVSEYHVLAYRRGGRHGEGPTKCFRWGKMLRDRGYVGSTMCPIEDAPKFGDVAITMAKGDESMSSWYGRFRLETSGHSNETEAAIDNMFLIPMKEIIQRQAA